MMELVVADISAVVEPSTTASAAAAFTGPIVGTLTTPVAAAYYEWTRRLREDFCGTMLAST